MAKQKAKYQAWGVVGKSYTEQICEISAYTAKEAKAKLIELGVRLTSKVVKTPRF